MIVSTVAPQVAELMASELGWNAARRKAEVENANAFLNTFDGYEG